MRWATRALGLVSTVILARLLAPEDFGVVAMAMVVVGFLEVFTQTGVDLALIRDEKVSAVHDVSDGGLLVAVAEMALAGNRGVELFPYEGKLPPHAVWFGEDQGRYVLAAAPSIAEEIAERFQAVGMVALVVEDGGVGLRQFLPFGHRLPVQFQRFRAASQ